MSVPVIDLFAGPGGLGEGFSQHKSDVAFDIAISIEKDEMAHETLRFRAAHRALSKNASVTSQTWERWDAIVEEKPWNIVFYELRDCGDEAIKQACLKAEKEALNLELGPENRDTASRAIRQRLAAFVRNGELPSNSVLIGGPPCQAYSVVGRSRNRGTKGYRPETDHRHFLYKEYLSVIAEFRPAIFVMENVKGILTSRVKDRQIFQTILEDLKRPGISSGRGEQVEYTLLALPRPAGLLDDPAPEDFIVKAEDHGIPQARHRVIILGVRKDVFQAAGTIQRLVPSDPPSVWDVIGDLPQLRPQISYRGRGKEWLDAFNDPLFRDAIREMERTKVVGNLRVAQRMEEVRYELLARARDPGSGADRMRSASGSRRKLQEQYAMWYQHRPTNLIANHESRAHMPSDLVRYLFVSCFGEVMKSSPRLADFPLCLLPEHRNVDPNNITETIFKDRFRVQLADRHSMTVTSHIAKDGHAFIHPKAVQCRSLTVREAARLQTFPDSYVFLGNRTSQYTQVGNAVPPLLAKQIADIVARVLLSAGLSGKAGFRPAAMAEAA